MILVISNSKLMYRMLGKLTIISIKLMEFSIMTIWAQIASIDYDVFLVRWEVLLKSGNLQDMGTVIFVKYANQNSLSSDRMA